MSFAGTAQEASPTEICKRSFARRKTPATGGLVGEHLAELGLLGVEGGDQERAARVAHGRALALHLHPPAVQGLGLRVSGLGFRV